ncbi:epi-neemfruitin B 7-O-acetyltransferse L7AT-like [Silene latifolia]|uniref:epi-neemfruitin B 7-O-acetyltransferse L7AT-like n=1 Tax=Silene latifolia TaxID=37657 RepID=UPI003D77C943
MRPRTNPPLPRDSMGNCVFDIQTKATRQGMAFQELVWEIHGSVSEAKSLVEKFQGVNGAEIIREYRMVAKQIDKECHSNVYRVTSWCKFGLNDADFRFGKLNLMMPVAGKAPKTLRTN